MSEHTEIELRKLVERVVRPVVAIRISKRKMREELLAHVQAVFDDELTATGDDRVALQRALQRFGEPSETTSALQTSIGRRERISARLERYMQVMWEPGDTPRTLMLRQAATIRLNLVILLPFMATIALFASRPGGILFAVKCSVALSLILPVFVGSFTFIPINFGDTIFGSPQRRTRRAVVLYGIGALVGLPAMSFLFYFALTGDLASAAGHSLVGCYFAPANLFLFYVAGRLGYMQMAGDHDWAMLNLDDEPPAHHV